MDVFSLRSLVVGGSRCPVDQVVVGLAAFLSYWKRNSTRREGYELWKDDEVRIHFPIFVENGLGGG